MFAGGRNRGPPPRLTYDGGDYTGSPQELANALKPAKRAAMPKPTPSQLAQRTTAPKAVAVEPPPTPTAAVAAADDGELTASGRRIRPKLAADESVAHVHTPAAAAPAVEHAPPTTSREDALLSALDMSLDDVVRGLDSFCATI